jgi:glycosyltransferase involved in cell wall biosynthesis
MSSYPDSIRLSVVVPVYNEEANVRHLVGAVRSALSEMEGGWELLLIDDGSHDRTAEIGAELGRRDPRVRLLCLARNFGQTAAMQAGFDHSRGDVVVSMDGDLQNDPADIQTLLDVVADGYDLVVGYRVRRRDALITRKIPSWVANRMIQVLTGIPIRDNGCSLKAYTRDLLDRLNLYSEFHRFIPAYAAATAGARIAEVPVRHHPRRFGSSKYGLSRIFKVLADMVSIIAIRLFRNRPLQMFGLGAAVGVVLGLAFAGAAALAFFFFHPREADALVLPTASLLSLGLAGYLLMLGLIAEVAVRVHDRGGRRQHSPIAVEVRP